MIAYSLVVAPDGPVRLLALFRPRRGLPFLNPGPGRARALASMPIATGHLKAIGKKGSIARAQEGITSKGSIIDI